MLSVYALLLSARPCCADKLCQQNISQQKNKIEKGASEEKDCPGCSPFFSCGSCPGFIVAKQLKAASPVLTELPFKAYMPYEQSSYKSTTLSVWQPPKLS
jgi:hypothetical protein